MFPKDGAAQPAAVVPWAAGHGSRDQSWVSGGAGRGGAGRGGAGRGGAGRGGVLAISMGCRLRATLPFSLFTLYTLKYNQKSFFSISGKSKIFKRQI